MGRRLSLFPILYFHFYRKSTAYCFFEVRVFARVLRIFRVFRGILRQLASQTLIVWGGCRFRPILQYRNLTRIESMAVHNCVKVLTVIEYPFTYRYFRQNPLYSIPLERADSQLSIDMCLVFLG